MRLFIGIMAIIQYQTIIHSKLIGSEYDGMNLTMLILLLAVFTVMTIGRKGE